MRTCKRLGIETVAVYSEADALALHVKLADHALALGPAESSKSYLAVDKIVRAALKSKSAAVHPGYGFLAENAAFVEALSKAKIKFIGPSAKAIRTLGDKLKAKEIAKKRKVPLLPSMTLAGPKDFEKVRKMGFPLIIKAAAGGGGRGMRKVFNASELEEQISSAAREAQAFFGDGRVYAEKLIEKARHVEVQVLADKYGQVVHLYDRDCTMQRHHQKVLEEAPAPNLRPAVREKLYRAATSLIDKSGYEGAATVEFLLDQDQDFYFMEVNSRLQVEHPVTEQITGLDLVELQILIAQGEKLSSIMPKLDSLPPQRHALECRICAEIPEENFIASTGKLEVFRQEQLSAADFQLRLDTGFRENDRVTHHYDSLIAKLVISTADRAQSIAAARVALERLALCGLRSNMGFLQRLLADPGFQSVSHHINYAQGLTPSTNERAERYALLCAVSYLIRQFGSAATSQDPWQQLCGFRVNQQAPFEVLSNIAGEEVRAALFPVGEDTWQISFTDALASERTLNLERVRFNVQEQRLYYTQQGREFSCKEFQTSDQLHWLCGVWGSWPLAPSKQILRKPKDILSNAHHEIASPLPGKILSVKVQSGSKVKAGDVLLIIESMKMEHPLKAPHQGIVQDLLVKSGESVEANRILARMDYEDLG